MWHDARALNCGVHGLEHVSAAHEHGAHCAKGAQDVLFVRVSSPFWGVLGGGWMEVVERCDEE